MESDVQKIVDEMAKRGLSVQVRYLKKQDWFEIDAGDDAVFNLFASVYRECINVPNEAYMFDEVCRLLKEQLG